MKIFKFVPTIQIAFLATALTFVGVYMTPGQVLASGYEAPTVVTQGATHITHNSFTASGRVLTSMGATNAWIEWGSDRSVEFTEELGPIYELPEDLSVMIDDLDEEETYYFRIVAQNEIGIDRGRIEEVRTIKESIPVVTPSGSAGTVQGANSSNVSSGTVSSSPRAKLTIDNDTDTVYRNDILAYRVEYAHLRGGNLNDATLIVTLPKEFRFLATTQGQYRSNSHTVIVDLNTIEPGEKGDFSITARASKRPSKREGEVIAKAELTFKVGSAQTKDKVTAEDKDVYDIAMGRFGAGAFGAGIMPQTFGGWLLFSIILVAIIITANVVAKRLKGGNEHQAHGAH